jgi:hypothetical protein
LFLPPDFLGQVNSIQWRGKHRLKELELLLLGSKLLRHLNSISKNNKTLVGWASRPPRICNLNARQLTITPKKVNPVKRDFHVSRSVKLIAEVEYKTTGPKLSEDRRTINFTDGLEARSFKLWGTRDLHFY